MFWLSHHFEAEWHRCFTIGGVRVCARCLGTYPALAAAFVTQVWLRAPLDLSLDLPIALALVLPATVDWAVGRFFPRAGSNGVRFATGVLLGLGLSRSLFIHVQRPFPPALLAQLVLVTVVSLPVILVTYRRSRAG